MKKTLRISCDVDGCILDIKKKFVEYFTLSYPNEVDDLDFNKYFYGYKNGKKSLKRKKCFDMIMSTNAIANLEFYDNAIDSFNNIAKNCEIYICSSLNSNLFRGREKNLSKLNYKTLHCYDTNEMSKLQMIRKLGDIDYVIEDKPKTIKILYNAGYKVLYPSWHGYTKGLEEFGIPFDSWKCLDDLLYFMSKSKKKNNLSNTQNYEITIFENIKQRFPTISSTYSIIDIIDETFRMPNVEYETETK